MASKVSTMCTYIPTEAEHPMLANQPQAAIITGWDELTGKANLTVFPDKASYVMVKREVAEGTGPGTFQQAAADAGRMFASAHKKA
jgi:hypothetical protein